LIVPDTWALDLKTRLIGPHTWALDPKTRVIGRKAGTFSPNSLTLDRKITSQRRKLYARDALPSNWHLHQPVDHSTRETGRAPKDFHRNRNAGAGYKEAMCGAKHSVGLLTSVNVLSPEPSMRSSALVRLAALLMVAACTETGRNAPGAGRSPEGGASSATQPAPPPGAPQRLQMHPGDSCRISAGGGVPASNTELGVPARAPHIRGLITEIEPLAFDSAGRRIRVVGQPGSAVGSEAIVAVSGTTQVAQRVGHRATASLLALCQDVSVWFDGPIRESLPPQGDAETVVIESIRELSRRVER